MHPNFFIIVNYCSKVNIIMYCTHIRKDGIDVIAIIFRRSIIYKRVSYNEIDNEMDTCRRRDQQ